MDNNEMFDLILSELKNLSQGQSELKEDVAELKQDVGVLKEDVAELKQDVGVLKEDVAELKQDVVSLKEGQANIEKRLDTVEKDIAIIKDETIITRHSTNILLRWAERSDRVIKVGLYDE